MVLTKVQLETINGINKFIEQFCESVNKNNFEFYTNERIEEIIKEEEDIDTIYYAPDSEWFEFEIEIESLLALEDDIKSIKIEDDRKVIRTNRFIYYLVESTDKERNHILKEFHNLNLKYNDIELSLVNESFIIKIAADHLGVCYDNRLEVTTEYLAIEIKKSKSSPKLSNEVENDLINSYIFEIADSTGIALRLSSLDSSDDYDRYLNLQSEAEENYVEQLRELEPYNIGMGLFVSAIQIQEEELKFLNFYKVIECFAPIAINIEANELMRKKLDAPKNLFEDGDYIKSIFELAFALKDRLNDEVLIKAAFNTCFDFVALFSKLPESIKKKIRSSLKLSNLTYSTKKENLERACNTTAKIVCKTRNKVVHAKSNFKSTGDECPTDDLPALNIFMKEACSQAIRWYSRQPNHLKQDVLSK